MKFKINGKYQEVLGQEGFSLADLIKVQELNIENIVVEYNLEIISKGKLEQIILKQDDSIEIVSFVGGG